MGPVSQIQQVQMALTAKRLCRAACREGMKHQIHESVLVNPKAPSTMFALTVTGKSAEMTPLREGARWPV